MLIAAREYLKRLRKAFEESSGGVVRIADITEIDDALVELDKLEEKMADLDHEMQRFLEHSEIPTA